ncbi:hypothetical protein EDD18DRAFT_1102325 [Armillaria luteobubalina]|uniref:Uncharacterized protein n=1 Tax=Armillaria luteobubalina TaxID=153913 RepID=A0AA39QC24_9AGAR|nr:hypothetical protein EDD18DRAFT_1102325 [Armillaria luteobubalina]
MYSVVALLLLPSLVTGVELVISPSCGTLYSEVGDLNSGLGSLSSYSTIVAFGDGYTAPQKTKKGYEHLDDGTTLAEAVQEDTLDPKAGGRMSNGPVWVEYVASDINATVKDYAVGLLFNVSVSATHVDQTQVTKSVVDDTQYPTFKLTLDERDFLYQGNLVISSTDKPDNNTTLFIVFHGMDDPETTFYYIPQYPSTVTHRLMADYMKAVFETCI